MSFISSPIDRFTLIGSLCISSSICSVVIFVICRVWVSCVWNFIVILLVRSIRWLVVCLSSSEVRVMFVPVRVRPVDPASVSTVVLAPPPPPPPLELLPPPPPLPPPLELVVVGAVIVKFWVVVVFVLLWVSVQLMCHVYVAAVVMVLVKLLVVV